MKITCAESSKDFFGEYHQPRFRGVNDLLKIATIDETSFKDIPIPCRHCLYWQTDGPFDQKMLTPEMERKKLEWINNMTREAGSWVKVAYLDDLPVGFLQCAKPKFFPRTLEYASGPPSDDALFLACLYILSKENRGIGIGTALLKDLLTELRNTKARTVETFARKGSAENPSGPLEFYMKHKFKIRNDDDAFPLLRLEL